MSLRLGQKIHCLGGKQYRRSPSDWRATCRFPDLEVEDLLGGEHPGNLAFGFWKFGLSSRARAPSSCSVCEYLKEVNKGAPSRPFALRRSSQLARNIKVTHPWEVVEETVLSD